METKTAYWLCCDKNYFGILEFHCSNCGKYIHGYGTSPCAKYCSSCCSEMIGIKSIKGTFDLNGKKIEGVEDGKTDKILQ